jgi:hypothetical protein
MRVPTIYLETTIFNFPFAGDAPQYQEDTQRLLAEVKAGKFRAYTSDYVVRELEAATVKGLDFIVSLNFRHIVKRKTIEATELINFREGYKKIGIYTPAEVIDYENV